MNTLIKVISFISYYFSPFLRQQSNPTTVECGIFRGDPFIHSFLDFFVTREVCVHKCVLHRSEEMVIRIKSGSILDVRGFSIQVVKVFASHFSQHAVERYYVTK